MISPRMLWIQPVYNLVFPIKTKIRMPRLPTLHRIIILILTEQFSADLRRVPRTCIWFQFNSGEPDAWLVHWINSWVFLYWMKKGNLTLHLRRWLYTHCNGFKCVLYFNCYSYHVTRYITTIGPVKVQLSQIWHVKQS